jgi:hypothetical protein
MNDHLLLEITVQPWGRERDLWSSSVVRELGDYQARERAASLLLGDGWAARIARWLLRF